jgi:preprotein translocase SecE subunit
VATNKKSADPKKTVAKAKVKKPRLSGRQDGQAAKEAVVVQEPKAKKRGKIRFPKFLRSFGGYFKGAWQEVRQVRWPNRRATWSLTLAVILFTLFWVGIIVGLDAIYDYLFNELIL